MCENDKDNVMCDNDQGDVMGESDQGDVMYESAGMLTGDALPKDKMAWYGILEFGVILKAADENASSVVRVSAP